MDVEVRLDALTSPNELLVTFRGSESVRDWLINMLAMMVRYDDCMVHAGFLASWCSIDLQVVDAIDKHMANSETKLDGIIVAGHSLGSAMATLCALDLRRVRPQYKVRLTTFAGPRVGDNALVKKLEVLQPMTICHHGDFVPRLPVFSLLARSLYEPCGLVTYTPPPQCKNLVSKHRMLGLLDTVNAISATQDDSQHTKVDA
jgi:pimeloyl-ACP methyl ester carboxylesterase